MAADRTRRDARIAVRPARRLPTWRHRLERRRTLRDVTINVPGARAPYVVTIPDDPDGVLDELAAPEPHMPYWATLWPSGLALAEVVLSRRESLRGRRVLELGCGLGVTATAAVEAGARLTAVDCFPEALAFARHNVLRNTGAHVRTRVADWRVPADRDALAASRVAVFLAADVLYEGEDVEPLLELGERALGAGGALWLAEPGRATSARFVAQARALGWSGQSFEIERDWPAAAGRACVRVHLFASG